MIVWHLNPSDKQQIYTTSKYVKYIVDHRDEDLMMFGLTDFQIPAAPVALIDFII